MTDAILAFNRRGLLKSAAALAALGAFGAGRALAQEAKSVAIALPTDPRSLDPLFRDDAVSGSIQRHLFDTLAHRGDDMVLRPYLATAIDREDSTKWKVTLREGVHFTNGEPVDAEAVRFSLERVLNPDNKATIRSQIEPLGKIEVLDPLTVRFETPNPDPLFIARLTWLQIVPPKYIAEAGQQFANKPIGSGPYKLKSWARNTEVALEVNPDFWGTKPVYSNVTFKVVPEEIARISALRSGDVQIAYNLSVNQANALSKEPGFRVVEQSTSRVAVLNFNPAAAPADKLEFRKAVASAVNREELQRGLIKQLGQLANSLFAPAIQNVPAGAAPGYAFSAEEAGKLINQAGLEGTAVEIGGSSGRFPLDRELVSAVAAQLKRTELNAKARVTEFGTYMTDIKAGRAAPVFLQVQGNAWFDPVPQLDAFYLSGGLGSPWKDNEMDTLLGKTYTAASDDERNKAIADVVRRINENLMSVPLFYYTYLHGTAEKIGWKPRADEFIFAFELT